MTDFPASESTPEEPTPGGPDPSGDPLPPVEPPSAGFIVQLFLVPAIIVIAIVGVWALFGRMAAGQQDWRHLVTALRSENQHRRDRAAVGLAQVLDADHALGERGQNLAENEEIATELTNLFRERLEKPSTEPDHLANVSLLARALGLLDRPEIVVPALQEAMDAEYDREVRKDAIFSVAVIANRATEDAGPDAVDDPAAEVAEVPGLVDDLVAASESDDEVVRNTATYALGLLPTDDATHRLRTLLDSSDANTRVNAALGLARRDSTAGLPVFETVLENASAALPVERQETVESRTGANLLFVTLLAAMLTALILAAASKGVPRYVGSLVAVGCLVGAGVVVAQTAEPADTREARAPAEAPREDRQRRPGGPSDRDLERVVALHTLQNTLKATGRLAPELTPPERDRIADLVRPIADSHAEPRIRIDATRALQSLEAAM